MANYSESNSSSGTLPFYNTSVESLLGKGSTLLGTQNWANPLVPQQQVAGFSGLQNQAFNLLPGMTGAWQPTVSGGLNALSSAQQSAQFDPNKLNQFMNPYIGGVVNEIARLGNQNFRENLLPGVRNTYGGLGQYGSAREALAIGKAAADTQNNISGQQANALSNAMNNAFTNYGNFAQLGAQTGLQAGNAYNNLATTQSQLGVVDYGTLFSAGQAQQQQDQSQLNATYQNQQAAQNRPWELLNNWSNLFKVNTPQSSTTSSWSTQLRRGGLVRGRKKKMATGGRPADWDGMIIDANTQGAREEERMRVLLAELRDNPNDESLIREISQQAQLMGVSDLSQFAPRRAPEPIEVTDASPGGGVSRSDFIRRMLDESRQYRQSIQSAFPEIEEPHKWDQFNRALFEANAMGPANFGQIIGRVGAGYYGNQDQLRRENFERSKARLTLEERALPRSGGLGGAMGGVEHFKTVRGKDGTLWAVSDVDPTRRYQIQGGGYSKEIQEAAAKAADSDLKDARFDTAAQRAEARTKLIDYYGGLLANKFGSRPDSNQPGGVPSERSGLVPSLSVPIPGDKFGARSDPGTIPTSQEEKEQQEVGKEMGKAFTELQTEARDSQSRLNSFIRLEELLTGVDTGKLTPLGTEISAWVKSAGTIPGMGWAKEVLPDFETLPNKEAARALMGQLALQMRNPAGGAGMPGALSDRDREFLVNQITPSLSLTPEGIKLMVDTQRKLAQRSQDVADLARRYRMKNPRKTFDEGFYTELNNWSTSHPLFNSHSRENSAQKVTTRPKEGEVVNGYRYNGGDLRDPNSWSKVDGQ